MRNYGHLDRKLCASSFYGKKSFLFCNEKSTLTEGAVSVLIKPLCFNDIPARILRFKF